MDIYRVFYALFCENRDTNCALIEIGDELININRQWGYILQCVQVPVTYIQIFYQWLLLLLVCVMQKVVCKYFPTIIHKNIKRKSIIIYKNDWKSAFLTNSITFKSFTFLHNIVASSQTYFPLSTLIHATYFITIYFSTNVRI